MAGGGEAVAGSSSDVAVVDLLRALQAVPMTFETLEKTKIGKTITGLTKHSSEQVRGLAGELYKNWRDLVNEHLTSTSSKSPAPAPTKMGPAPAADHAKKAKTTAVDKPAPAAAPRKTASSERKEAPAVVDEVKLAAAKRKLQEGYKEAALAKKQRRIQVIDAPMKTNRRPVAVVERRRIAPVAATVHPLRMCRAA